MDAPLPRIVMTAGEPAGIGPDLAIAMAQQSLDADLTVVGDPEVLLARARQLGVECAVVDRSEVPAGSPHVRGRLVVHAVPCAVAVSPGVLEPRNADAVMESIRFAIDGCLAGNFDAMVTGPVHKAVIIDGGFTGFTGHTEFLAERAGVAMPVMLLASDTLRVALVTIHIPLSEVSAAITPQRLEDVIRVLHHDLQNTFRIDAPVIGVCGLNPHAGESGHLGMEEIEVIEPTLERLRGEGLKLIGPVPADTAFTPGALTEFDAVLSMYHDQGLPVIKHQGFDRAVNVTLGLPVIRTSVDHGTALDLAGTGKADAGSLIAATTLAVDLATKRRA